MLKHISVSNLLSKPVWLGCAGFQLRRKGGGGQYSPLASPPKNPTETDP